jgi:hypothetical protein
MKGIRLSDEQTSAVVSEHEAHPAFAAPQCAAIGRLAAAVRPKAIDKPLSRATPKQLAEGKGTS